MIGDLIRSRRAGSRAEIQTGVEAALERVNRRFSPEQPFRFTIGDEFQGVVDTVRRAAWAATWIRLETIGVIGVRLGIGWGTLEILDSTRSPMLQDGPCWWRARDAIKTLTIWERSQRTPRSTSILAVTGDGREGPFNAGLILVGHLLSGFDTADATIAIMLSEGHTQEEAADRLGLHKSSVSRRMQSHGIGALLAAYDAFGPS